MGDELPSVYVETSVLSYLAARPSSNLIVAAHQELSRQWWATDRFHYRAFVSNLVLEEASDGDPDAASRRLMFASTLPLLSWIKKRFFCPNSFLKMV